MEGKAQISKNSKLFLSIVYVDLVFLSAVNSNTRARRLYNYGRYGFDRFEKLTEYQSNYDG